MGIFIGLLLAIAFISLRYRISNYKGFIPWFWIFGLGIFGLGILFILPSSESDDISVESIKKRKLLGNIIGVIFTCIYILLCVTFMFWYPKFTGLAINGEIPMVIYFLLQFLFLL